MADDWTSNWWALARAYWTVDIYSGSRAYQAGMRRHAEPVRHLLAVHWCMSEVMNGGLEQLFFNNTGVLVPEAVQGLDAIGMPDLARKLERAMAMLGPTYPRNRKAREKVMDEFFALLGRRKNPWERLQQSFFARADACAAAADAYAARHQLIPQGRRERAALKKEIALLRERRLAEMGASSQGK